MMPPFAYVRPLTVADAVRELARPGTRAHAGGTDLLGCLRDGVFGAQTVVSLGALDELRGMRTTSDGGLRIGALTPVASVAADATVRERWPGLAQAAGEVASPQLRNQGTLGGNLCQKPRCWYYRGEFHCLRKGGDVCYAADGQNQQHAIFGGVGCYVVHPSDTAPMLAALGATVRVTGPGGERQVAADAFHVLPEVDVERETVLEPGEIVTEIVLPPPVRGARSVYRKVRSRRAWDFALAAVAPSLGFDGRTVREARVFLGGVAPVPWRARGVEAAIVGRELTPEVARAAGEAAVEGAEPLAKNRYKVALVRGAVEETLLAMGG